MNESKHTPGQWQWHFRPEDKDAPGSVFAESHPGQAYAVAMMPCYQTKEQWEADARLIAAAPELLEACESALIQIRTLDPQMKKDMATPAVIEGLLEAIIKAKGEC